MDEKRKAGRPKGTTKPELLAMDEAQLERLFKAVERTKDRGAELAFKIAFHFGLRVTEVCQILLNDIYLGAQLSDITFTVEGIKHGRKRVYQSTEIDAKLAYLLRDWIRKRRRADQRNPYLFPSTKYYDRPLTAGALKDKFKRYLKRAGLPSYFSMHSLRHSCAVHLIRGGAGPVDVMNWLIGWRNIADPADSTGRRRTVKLVPEEAEMVQRAFEFYDSGDYSIEMLPKEFKNRGFQISVRGVQEILKRTAYYGWFSFKGQLYKWDQEPLITKDLFDRVQLRLSQACTSPHKNARKWFAFKKFLRCGYCGGSFTAQDQAGITYYNCNNRSRNIERCPQPHYFPEEQINSIITSEIGSLRIDSGWMEKLKAQLKEGRERDDIRAANERKRLEIELAKFKNRANRLIDAWTDGLISKEEYKAKRSEYSERIAQVESELKATEKLNTDYKEQGAEILDLLRHFPDYYRKADLRGKQALLNVCLDQRILRGDQYQISWKPPFDLLFPMAVIKRSEWGE